MKCGIDVNDTINHSHPLTTTHWTLDNTGHWTLDTGHWTSLDNTGHWTLDTGHWTTLDTGQHWTLDSGTMVIMFHCCGVNYNYNASLSTQTLKCLVDHNAYTDYVICLIGGFRDTYLGRQVVSESRRAESGNEVS